MTETVSEETARRRRGRKPADAGERRRRVQSALADLQESRTPFSMSDLAERAGISRATLYRDASLRDLVGSTGDGPANRPVSIHDYEKQKSEREKLAAERRVLRRQLREHEETKAGLEREIVKLEAKIEIYVSYFAKNAGEDSDSLRKEAFAEGFAQGVRTAMGQRGGSGANGAKRPGMGVGMMGSAPTSLAAVAAKLPKPALQTARKNLARVLHPDLFAGEDAATAALATELLKQLNSLIAESEKRTGGP
ncbi:MAG: hypothetical protein H7145_25305 [Akkermansiaceae bacterium]|nr:hypothetical protein [Armatimonadota bacterium]